VYPSFAGIGRSSSLKASKSGVRGLKAAGKNLQTPVDTKRSSKLADAGGSLSGRKALGDITNRKAKPEKRQAAIEPKPKTSFKIAVEDTDDDIEYVPAAPKLDDDFPTFSTEEMDEVKRRLEALKAPQGEAEIQLLASPILPRMHSTDSSPRLSLEMDNELGIPFPTVGDIVL